MISVLIPTYDWDVTSLVTELHQQLLRSKIPFEIILIDDCSGSKLNFKNEEINNLEYCSYSSLKKNIGRSALRNLLMQKANYEWLLFLDADVLPVSGNFIQNYIDATAIHPSVMVGGIVYQNNETSHLLRWKFGKKSEEQSVFVRNSHPYKYFFSGNFFIKKSVAKKIQFDESLTKYGYEDLLFAKEIEQLDFGVHHLDNPVFHLGIDKNKQYIEKTKHALANMVFLLKSGKISSSDARIVSVYKKLNFFGITTILSSMNSFFEQQTIKNSSLTMFNLFRLGYLHQVLKKAK